MGKKIALGILFSCILFMTVAQEISPFGKFLKDSTMIGEEVQYSLSVKYPLEWQVVFPDSLYNFEPFEYYEKAYFTTRTDSTHAYDSVIYTLATFEIDLVQQLQLPIYLIEGGDSTSVLATPDSIFLKEMVTVMPDSLAFRENLTFQAVNYAFNYPYFLIGSGILLIVGLAILLIFGKSIRAKIKLHRMRKSYEKYIRQLEFGIKKVKKDETDSKLIEEVLVVWKKYMEKLEDRPYTKYTSKEILKLGFENTLKITLQDIDRALYGASGNDAVHKNFEALEDFTAERYQLKIKEVQNG